jgi:ABC-type bacteriocin/lantibiotic exporter with double-glycine peptidase domain
MKRINFISSYEHSECGLACVAMMINYYSQSISLTDLREVYGVPTGGLNINQMIEISGKYDVPAKAMKVNDIKELAKINEPFIAHWNSTHFVIVEKFKKKKVSIVDPAKGKLNLSVEEFKASFSNVIICSLVERNKHKRKKVRNKSLIDIIKKNKKALIWTIAFSFFIQLLTLYIPIYIKELIDSFNSIENYTQLIIVLFFIIAFYYSFSIIKMRIITLFQNNFDRLLTSKTVSHLMELPLKFFVSRGKGELIFTINSNQYIRALLSTQMISLFIDIVFLILYLLLMLFYSVQLTLITVVLGFVLVSISIINTKLLIKKNQSQITAITDVQNITGEMVSNISTIKAVGAEEELLQKWANGFEKQLMLEKEKAKIDSVLGNIPSTIQITYSLIIFVVGILIGREAGLSIGTIVAFNTLGASFLSPMLSIANSYLQFSAAKIYINRLLDIINSKTENRDANAKDIYLQNGDICLNDIYFKYDFFSDYVLREININIKSGEKVAIVGESGSGKSTLMMLIAGLYEPTKGIVEVGKAQINNVDVNKRSYRRQLGIVLQESMLFNGTIKDNILMGRNADDKEIEQAIVNSSLEKFIQKFPSRLETIISEDGNNISGGQRQRLCIARAVLKRPKLILMDEPTSSLDNISENNIMDNLFKMDSTILVVAHRLANISRFDRVIVMDNGSIVSVGSHEELLKNSSYYQELYAKK